jgi:hypothetical protein
MKIMIKICKRFKPRKNKITEVMMLAPTVKPYDTYMAP